ncbi:reticulophagy regulator 3 [Latimeria chalumnae]|uniref:Reticulophagy regulator family member 3 n=1 Tax=Latimeria chalumnae TaxID=7897 RepID=H3AJH2_LATCH|nr:PREDICTED: protein FAM134C [Latimeria chalumnae]|eukprot:XP_005994086.1 PREDICTED: protein FAM134C [Latimeria chalumnae]
MALQEEAARSEASSQLSVQERGLRSRPASSLRAGQVQAVKASLLDLLGPYEPLLTCLQSVLVWEKPLHSVLVYLGINVVFWFFALVPLRLVFLLAFSMILVVCIDQWKNKVWPEIKVAQADEQETESWGFVEPKLLSVPELCHHIAEVWVSCTTFLRNLKVFKAQNPGKFCLLVCGVFTFLAVLGRYIPGLLLLYIAMLAVMLWPLAVYHSLGQRIYAKVEPALSRLDFSVRGYMMSREKDRQLRHSALNQGLVDDRSDSEEELAAFCPKVDDLEVAKELEISDSEHSDAEVSCADNGTFNLSRGQTPLTEGSEDLDRHSDPEESFARDLPDFPSINPDVTGIDDEDDTSIGIPAVPNRAHGDPNLFSDQEDIDADLSLSGPQPPFNLGSSQGLDIQRLITTSVIQLALAGASQPHPQQSEKSQGPAKTYKSSSSEMDTDAEGDDFELLDQSELNQIDPTGSQGR